MSNPNRYTVYICHCGHIHFIENSKIDEALETNSCLMTVCGHCGEIHIIGGDYVSGMYIDGEEIEGPHYDMWSETIRCNDSNLILSELKYRSRPIYEIIFSSGKAVQLKNGKIASHFSKYGDIFWTDELPGRMRSDLEAFIAESPNTLAERLLAFYDSSNAHDSVDMDYILSTYSDEELLNLSKYVYRCFDWSNTKYDR